MTQVDLGSGRALVRQVDQRDHTGQIRDTQADKKARVDHTMRESPISLAVSLWIVITVVKRDTKQMSAQSR